MNLLQIHINVFHLTWTMSLHYLVKLELLIAHVLPLSCYRKKLQNLSRLNYGFTDRQIWIRLITACAKYCKTRCIKHASLIWTNWNSDWERSGPNWVMSSLRQARQPFVGVVVDSSISVKRVLYTFCCNISHTLLSVGFKSGEFEGHSWDKFWSFSLWQLNGVTCTMSISSFTR